MPRYLFNKAHLKKLIDESPKNTNVIGIYVKHLKSGNGLTTKIEAKAAKFNTTTGTVSVPTEKKQAKATQSAMARKSSSASEESVAAGSPVCPTPPGCADAITATLGL